MKRIWGDDGTTSAFREEFESWAEENGGTVETSEESTLFCEFESTVDHPSFRLGVYEADGSIDGSTLILKSDQGSRQFEIDLSSGNWSVRKRPI
ncbi:MAG: hypothetical protein ABEI99_10140 [Halobaculum sp.]